MLALVGCFTKSAQLVFHSWLPEAMEGPTPVSALIHAATMVTAGVFLLIRLSPLIEHFTWATSTLTFVGGITSVTCALWATKCNCIKKIVAMSTCSQLGYMTMCCGLGLYKLALAHLVFHGCFKGLLFLTCANIISARSGEQSIMKGGWTIYGYNMGSIQYVFMLIGSLAIMGFPFFTGFYSKELIIEVASLWWFHLPFTCSMVAAYCTVVYSIRLQYHEFYNEFTGWKTSLYYLTLPAPILTIPLVWLSFATVVCGYTLHISMGVGCESSATGYNLSIIAVLFLAYLFMSVWTWLKNCWANLKRIYIVVYFKVRLTWILIKLIEIWLNFRGFISHWLKTLFSVEGIFALYILKLFFLLLLQTVKLLWEAPIEFFTHCLANFTIFWKRIWAKIVEFFSKK